MIGLLFIPGIIASTMAIVFLAHGFWKTSYIPVLVWMLIFMAIIERVLPFKKAVIKKENVMTDVIFILINPVLLPVLWYLLFKRVFFLELNPGLIFDSMPFLVQFILFFTVSEFFRYWAHRLQHEVPFFWKFHAVHHCMPQLYYLNQYISHPVDYFFRNVITLTPLILFKFDPWVVAYSQGLSTLFGMLGHANTTIKNGFWNYIFPTYEIHRWHHSYLPKEANANYGVGLMLWDHIFKSFKHPNGTAPERTGIEDTTYEIHDWQGLMKRPFQKKH